MHVPRMRCHALTIDEIHELEEDFRRSVQVALRSGADCVGIHAYGGYLTDQFLTRRWNTRTDTYGGSLENRARFLTELIAICKEEGGADFPVIVKFTPDHYMDGEGYRSIDEGIALAKLIVAAGADALHVDAGCHENWPNAMPPAGMQQMTLQSRSAKIIRSVVDVPVMTHGRFGDVDKAEAALRDGVCDIAVIGRGLLADPDLPNKVLAGRPDTIRPCISCNEGCIARVYNGEAATCALNPRCGHEDGSIDIPPAAHPKKLLVVGARPCRLHGGALRQTGRPHGRDLGGGRPHRRQRPVRLQAVFQARHAPHDRLFRARAARQRHPRALLHHGDAGARRGLCARPHSLGGRRPAIAPKAIPGLDCPKVYFATEALCDCCDVGDRVVVIGGGLVGVEAALQMDMWGKHVTCIDMARTIPSEPGFKMNDMLMRDYMARSDVDFRPATKLVRIDGDAFTCSVTVEHAGEQQQIACDTVLLALGFAPTAQAAAAFESVAPVTVLGDAQQPRKILFAVGDAHEAVRKLSGES